MVHTNQQVFDNRQSKETVEKITGQGNAGEGDKTKYSIFKLR